jgi:hypothetical protein
MRIIAAGSATEPQPIVEMTSDDGAHAKVLSSARFGLIANRSR